MTTPVFFNIVSKNDEKSVVVTVAETGDTLVADGNHPSYSRILSELVSTSGIIEDLRRFIDLFDVQAAINNAFAPLTERVVIRGGKVYFDGDPVYNEIAEVIVKFWSEQADVAPLANFMEKIATNPSADSRERLFAWLRLKSFALTPDGDIVAYKSVYRYHDTGFRSISAGTAYVNGQQITGQIPQVIGDVVTMPRSSVDDNTHAACSTGLHVGTYDYAKNFSGDALLAIRVNPRDIVSVPRDSGNAKVRVCRYEVLAEITDGLEFADMLFQLPSKPDAPVDEYGAPYEDTYEDDDFGDDELEDQIDDAPVDIEAELNSLGRDAVRKIARRFGLSRGKKRNMISSIITNRTPAEILKEIKAL